MKHILKAIHAFLYQIKKHIENSQNNIPYVKNGKYNLKYLVFPSSALDYHIICHGIYNDFLTNNLKFFIKNDDVIFDVGANAGYLSLPFAKIANSGMVISYEPDMDVYCRLRLNLIINELTNIKAYDIALQDDADADSIAFNVRRCIDGDKRNNDGLSSIKNIELHKKCEYVVSCSTIDRQFNALGLKKLDFIKIDVEGCEIMVLRGAKDVIKRFMPTIFYESSIVLDNLSNSSNVRDSFYFLKEMGYCQFMVINESYLQEIVDYPQNVVDSNILCIHKSKLGSCDFLVKMQGVC